MTPPYRRVPARASLLTSVIGVMTTKERHKHILSRFGIYLGFHIERSVFRLSGGADCLGKRVSHGHLSGI